MHQLAPTQQPCAHAGADGDVNEIIESVRFGQSRRIHIGIDCDTCVWKSRAEHARDGKPGPARFRGGQDGSIIGAFPVHTHRTKSRNSDRIRSAAPVQPCDRPCEGLGSVSRRVAVFLLNGSIGFTRRDHSLGASHFNPCDHARLNHGPAWPAIPTKRWESSGKSPSDMPVRLLSDIGGMNLHPGSPDSMAWILH
jgi:hypothetical protein